MTTIHLAAVKPLKSSKFWLLGIAAGLIAIQLTLSWHNGQINMFTTSVLFWFAACSLVWEKRNIKLETGVISSLIGTLIIAVVLLKSTNSAGNFYYISPLVSAVGLTLLASGFKGLKQYWQELLILFFLGVPQIVLPPLVDISELTAKFAAFVLSHFGFEISRQGVYLTLATGAVEVNPQCSGIQNILQLCSIAVLFLMMFPLDWKKKVLVPIVAICLGFTVNGVRVALMTLLVAYSSQANFEYWHKGDGSQIFALISALTFGLFCFLMLRLDEIKDQESVKF